ncbi:MAG: hypothetical protein Ct9H300mP29_8740 [Candidatus Neomarinimicrobiota bacterium]|nr:MAG: hypothetical protein Ct9H300mP29_8740 [Candidatus Neomarinimicrobiota bacterium]
MQLQLLRQGFLKYCALYYSFLELILWRDWVDIFAITFASLTIIIASLIAISRDNLKARLAFSTNSSFLILFWGLRS